MKREIYFPTNDMGPLMQGPPDVLSTTL